MTGWKHWVAKPLDHFFNKNGAGTFLPIKISGPTGSPRFGLDRGRKDDKATFQRQQHNFSEGAGWRCSDFRRRSEMEGPPS